MVPQIKVLLQAGDNVIDINQHGLTTLRFERYLNDPQNRTSNILTDLDFTVYDTSGYTILSAIQSSGGVFLRYGIDTGDPLTTRMSEVYKITPTRYNVVQNNRGIMLGVGGYGTQLVRESEAKYYREGTPIKQIILDLARLNGWDTNNGKFINVKGNLPNVIYQPANQTDFTFIKDTLLKIADNTTVYDEVNNLVKGYTGFYDAVLQERGSRVELHIFAGSGEIERTVWKYSFGTDTESQVLDMTNKINYDWIINGLTLQVPLFESDLAVTEETLKADYSLLLDNITNDILLAFENAGITLPELTNLTYRFQFIEPEGMEYKTREQIVNDKLKDIISTLNTIELVVVGNPAIMATDLVELRAVNEDGKNMIQQGLWKVVGITENIGLGGYQTHLRLVRESPDISLLPSQGYSGKSTTTTTNKTIRWVEVE